MSTVAPQTELPLSRRDRIRLLAEHYLDWVPSPPYQRLAEGEPQGTWVPCETCDGTGRLTKMDAPCLICKGQERRALEEARKRWAAGQRAPVQTPRRNHGCRPCLECQGTGERKATRREIEDGLARDPYVRHAPRLLREVKQVQKVKRDVEERGERFAWEVAQEELYKHGSFQDFGRAMEWLADVEPERHSLIWRVLVCQEPVTLLHPGALDRALDILGSRMPSRVLVPYWLLPGRVHGLNVRARRNARGRHADRGVQSARDREIMACYVEGVTVGELARRFGVSHARVSQIVAPVRRGIR